MKQKIRKLSAYKRNIIEPLEWVYLSKQQVVFHHMKSIESVNTPDGKMISALIRYRVELLNPNVDIIAFVGYTKLVLKNGHRCPQQPGLWYWNDKFWLNAVNLAGEDYYYHKQRVIYEVMVKDKHVLFNGLTNDIFN